MRLAILLSLAGPWQRETAQRLAELGHEVCVICLDRPRGDQYLSVDDPYQAASIHSLRDSVEDVSVLETRSSSPVRYISSAGKLGVMARAKRVDALLTLYGGGHAAMAYASGFRPYSIYAVGSDILLAGGVKRWIGRVALNRATPVFANGRFLAEKAREMAPRADIVPVYLGVDRTRFRPGAPAPEPVRIVCTRGFTAVYNNEYLIHALAAMPKIDREIKITFMAGGHLLERARALADRILPAVLRSSVEFEGGASRERVAEALRESHIYVSLSRSDGTSVSLMEALSCGLFPVLSDIPPNREWIDVREENGLLVPFEDPRVVGESLARAVIEGGARAKARRYNLRVAEERADGRRNMAFLASTLLSRIGHDPTR